MRVRLTQLLYVFANVLPIDGTELLLQLSQPHIGTVSRADYGAGKEQRLHYSLQDEGAAQDIHFFLPR